MGFCLSLQCYRSSVNRNRVQPGFGLQVGGSSQLEVVKKGVREGGWHRYGQPMEVQVVLRCGSEAVG